MTRKLLLLSSTIWASSAGFAQTQVEPPPTPTPSAEASVESPPPATPEDAETTTADEANASDGEIIVTAQRREQRLQDVPLSVNVVSGESLTKSGTTDLVRLSERTPGVILNTGPQSNTINIRGVGSGLNAGFEQSVGTFVDGVYRPRSRMTRAGLFDVERVEVLNGPQTTFFGNNTVAGAINITTKKPSQQYGYEALTLYAPADGQYILSAAVTGPVSDELSLRAAGQLSGMDGYTYNEFLGRTEPHMRDFVGRVSARYEPSESFRSDLRLDLIRNRDRGTSSAEVVGCPADATFGAPRGPCGIYLQMIGGSNPDNEFNFRSVAPPSSFNMDAWEAAWTNQLEFGNVNLTSITSYSDQESRTFLNATPLPATGVQGFFHQPFSQAETYEMYAQELRLDGAASDWLDYIVGAYYSHGDLSSQSVSSLYNSTAIGTAGAPVTGPQTPIETNRNLFQIDQTRSVYGQITAKFTSALRLNLGLRYTSVKKEASRSFRIAIGNENAVLEDLIFLPEATQALLAPRAGGSRAPFTDPEKVFNKLMPSASLQYDVLPTVTAYASYVKGFKAGGYSDSNGPNEFDSENVNSYEVGIKGSIFDRALFFTLDAFYLDYSGLQQALTTIGPTGVSITTVGNAAASRSKGIEFTGALRATDYLSFNLAGAYIDSKFTDYPNAACTVLGVYTQGSTCVQDLSGKPTPFAPKFSANLSASARVPMMSGYELTVEPAVFVTSSWYLTATIDPLIKQEGYASFDLRAGFGPEDDSWEVAVIGRNLTDEKVLSYASSVGTSPGMVTGLLQRGGSVAIQLTVRH